MIVDTSAILAILLREEEASSIEALIAASSCRMSVANILEASMVTEPSASQNSRITQVGSSMSADCRSPKPVVWSRG